jgi:allantoicase
VDCLRYIAAYQPKFHKHTVKVEEPWWAGWKKRRDKANGKGKGVVNLAPNSYSFQYDVT